MGLEYKEELKQKYPDLTEEQIDELDEVFTKARKAFDEIKEFDQEKVDKLCRAVAWSVANKRLGRN